MGAAAGEHVKRAQQSERGFHDLARGQRFAGQRRVVGHRDPGSGTGGVDGEFQHAGFGKPERQLPPQPPHPGPVGLRPFIQGALVIRWPAFGANEDPDQQFVRVVVVAQQHDALHRARRETGLHFATDLAPQRNLVHASPSFCRTTASVQDGRL